MTAATQARLDALPLLTRTPARWAESALADPIALLVDHAFLEKKAANNAMDMMIRWPGDWLDGWVETMTGVARDEAAHLAQVTRILLRRGGRLTRVHKNPYANGLRALVRRGESAEALDRLFVSALIEARSCERFAVLAEAAPDPELRGFYSALLNSELGHFKVFLRLARRIAPAPVVEARWLQMLESESAILSAQEPGSRIHSGVESIQPPPSTRSPS